jgi:hypothetical protein
MREAGKPAKLGELLGKSADKEDMGLKDLPELLGEQMPDMPMNRLGKYRLMQALKIRFCAGYRNLPMIKNLIHEFDEEMKIENVVKMNKKGYDNGNE